MQPTTICGGCGGKEGSGHGHVGSARVLGVVSWGGAGHAPARTCAAGARLAHQQARPLHAGGGWLPGSRCSCLPLAWAPLPWAPAGLAGPRLLGGPWGCGTRCAGTTCTRGATRYHPLVGRPAGGGREEGWGSGWGRRCSNGGARFRVCSPLPAASARQAAGRASARPAPCRGRAPAPARTSFGLPHWRQKRLRASGGAGRSHAAALPAIVGDAAAPLPLLLLALAPAAAAAVLPWLLPLKRRRVWLLRALCGRCSARAAFAAGGMAQEQRAAEFKDPKARAHARGRLRIMPLLAILGGRRGLGRYVRREHRSYCEPNPRRYQLIQNRHSHHRLT